MLGFKYAQSQSGYLEYCNKSVLVREDEDIAGRLSS